MSWLTDKSQKQDTVFCPVCTLPRNKGNHTRCSKITQQKSIDEKNSRAQSAQQRTKPRTNKPENPLQSGVTNAPL